MSLVVAAILTSAAGGARSAELSDNTGLATAGTESVTVDRRVAARFTTDAAATYSLTSVTLVLGNATAGSAELALYSDGDLEPGTHIAALTSPEAYSTTPAATRFTTAGIALDASTTYWLVLKATAGAFEWAWTADGTASGAGFDATWDVSEDGGSSWYTQSIYPMQLRVSVNEAVDVVTFRRGDSNQDGKLDISDPLTTLGFLFLGADPGTLGCRDAADSNDDGKLDLSDAVYALSFEFLGGEDLPAPGPNACGPDPTTDDLVECVYDADACKQ